ncbi:hypothetical protein SAMN04244572_04352 [Azotobacter beijerinckii]|uniref:Uncharacterized protein n=1 Tax=Azotobacter beijerinckii TaxID=170623 RepID=A0A1H6ZVV0_9GAMM|nr:hypothetical protein [Azotobacter beijerinckii]SEJ52925.1 hypothetical protein SAMN04244572_04352 [Azotobacter beijerinckii]
MVDLIAAALAWGYVGYLVGYLRAQKRYIPEINEAREDLARARMLAKMHCCPADCGKGGHADG